MAAPDPWMILPFALLLGAMALGPLRAPEWWLRHYAGIALGLGAVTLGYYLFVLRDVPRVLHTGHDYISFIALIGSLFVVSGGIHIGVKGEATPLANVIFLFVGAIVANVLGTTGAAMLLIRPWIQINRSCVAAYHIVFFIFIVANIGGGLTPIGDPPLFLGYLQGVPFWWIAKNCWPMWATGIGILLAVFYVLDRANCLRASSTIRSGAGREDGREASDPETMPARSADSPVREFQASGLRGHRRPCSEWRCDGLPNLLFLAVILGAVFVNRPVFLREALMLAAALGSYFTTPKSVHVANDFNFHPVREVVILFAGIFATMMPALDWLNFNARSLLGDQPSPGIFFWGTGILSSALDNAPTYLGFLNALSGVTGSPEIPELLRQSPASLLAISVGAVFFGAATYIGNGPNFMVKAIADQRQIQVPTFLGFVFKFTLPFLLPALLVVWLLFFRG